MSYGLCSALFDLWFRGRGEPLLGTCFIMGGFALVILPSGLLCRALFKRDWFEVINVAAIVAATVAALSFFSLIKSTGLEKGLLQLPPGGANAQVSVWWLALRFLHLVLAALFLRRHS